MTASGQRLFLALWPEAPVQRALLEAQAQLPLARGSRPVAPGRLHLTLHFIGTVPDAAVPALQAALDLQAEPCTLRLDRIELWPRGLLVWRATDPPQALLALHVRLGAALRALGLPVERRAFRPHVTLAREAAPGGPWPAQPPLHWPLAAHRLVCTGAQGAYRALQVWPWAAETVGATSRTPS